MEVPPKTTLVRLEKEPVVHFKHTQYIDERENPALSPDHQIIQIGEIPKSPKWTLTPLYKVSATGALTLWQVGFDGKNQLEMTYGHVDGPSGYRTDLTEVIPKVNRTMQQQALQEASQRYKEKYRSGHRPAGAQGPTTIKGMKGKVYLKEAKIHRWPVAVQVKVDGVRALVQDLGYGNITIRSYLDTYYQHLGHITKDLETFLVYLPPYSTLDGEIVYPGHTFNETISVLKKIVNIDPRVGDLAFYVFDIYFEENPSFDERYSLLFNAYKRYLADGNINKSFSLLTITLAWSHNDILSFRNQFIDMGYEGVVIKKLALNAPRGTSEYSESVYEQKRSSNILKYKDFIDEEATILAVLDTATGKEKGKAMLEVRDPRGNIFLVRMKGSFERRENWLAHPELVVGKQVTIRYYELSEYGVPRFPIGQELRDYE
jgi:hypothetical protein